MNTLKKQKLSVFLEMLAVYILLLAVAACSTRIGGIRATAAVKMLLYVLAYAVIASVPALVLRIRKIPLSALGLSRERIPRQLLTALFILAATVSVFVILPLLAGFSRADVLNFKSSSRSVLAFYIVYDIICVGFGEEIAFRGYFYGRIRAVSPSGWTPVLLSALLFGLWHFPATRSLVNVAVTAIMGLVYGICRWKIKNCTLLSLALAHGFHDAVIVVLSYILL